jgi:hypothetical protein
MAFPMFRQGAGREVGVAAAAVFIIIHFDREALRPEPKAE